MSRPLRFLVFSSALAFSALALAACTVTTSGYVRTEVSTAPQAGR